MTLLTDGQVNAENGSEGIHYSEGHSRVTWISGPALTKEILNKPDHEKTKFEKAQAVKYWELRESKGLSRRNSWKDVAVDVGQSVAKVAASAFTGLVAGGPIGAAISASVSVGGEVYRGVKRSSSINDLLAQVPTKFLQAEIDHLALQYDNMQAQEGKPELEKPAKEGGVGSTVPSSVLDIEGAFVAVEKAMDPRKEKQPAIAVAA